MWRRIRPDPQLPQVDDLVGFSALARAERIRRRDASCVEVMLAYLDHIGRFNPKLNAIVAMRDSDELLAEARRPGDELTRGQYAGALAAEPRT